MQINPSGKYYRVIKDNFMWKAGAILEYDEKMGSKGGYKPLNDLDIWDATGVIDGEYISAPIIETNPEWFLRVYSTGDEALSTKEEALKKFNFQFKPDSITIKTS